MSASAVSRGPLVGIDLGTTNSVIACLDADGTPESIVNFEGDVITPSAIFVEGEDVLVGREAIKAASRASHNFAELFKRHMGSSEFPQLVAGRTWRPEELSAIVLKRLRADAIRRLGSVGPAVITVPAYFDESHRQATYEAAEIAGWEVLDLINEPTAAAIAFAASRRESTTSSKPQELVLVFDLGGGTLDVTLLEVTAGNVYRTLATDGEVQLGGCDWDVRLRDYLAEVFQSMTGVDPLAVAAGKTEFSQLAERVKRRLSDAERWQVPCSFGGKKAVLRVERALFEALTADLLDRGRSLAQMVLDETGKKWSEVDTLLAVGGSTRMPMVQNMLAELWGRPPYLSLSVEEAVAHGAAVFAKLKAQDGCARVVNVNSHTYRVIAVRQGEAPLAHPLIPRNSPLPAQGSQVFPVRTGQTTCRIEICEGEMDAPEYCLSVGKVVIGPFQLPEGLRGLAQVRLTCQEDGRLHVEAFLRDAEDRKRVLQRTAAVLEPSRGMSAEQLDAAKRFVASLQIH